jgi:hypothetical protein
MPLTDIVTDDYTAGGGDSDRTVGGTVAAPPSSADVTAVPGGGSSGCCCGAGGVSVFCCPDGQTVPTALTLTITTDGTGGCPECVGTVTIDLVYDAARLTWLSTTVWSNPDGSGRGVWWEVACFGTWQASIHSTFERTPNAGTFPQCMIYAGSMDFGFTDDCDPFFLTATGTTTCPTGSAGVTFTVTPT